MDVVIGGCIFVGGMLIGVLIGLYVGINRMRQAVENGSVGDLRIDRSDPDEPPQPYLELTGASIESISRLEFIVLKVVNEDYLSRK